MNPTREQFELAAKFMGYKPCNGVMTDADDFLIGLKVQTAPNVKASYWYPLRPGEDAYRLLVKVLHHCKSSILDPGEPENVESLYRKLCMFLLCGKPDAAAEAAFNLAVELGRGI